MWARLAEARLPLVLKPSFESFFTGGRSERLRAPLMRVQRPRWHKVTGALNGGHGGGSPSRFTDAAPSCLMYSHRGSFCAPYSLMARRRGSFEPCAASRLATARCPASSLILAESRAAPWGAIFFCLFVSYAKTYGFLMGFWGGISLCFT